MFAIKTLNSSFAEIDAMDLSTLTDLIRVYEKISVESKDEKDKITYIDDIL